jgi:hypothetical protein
MVMTTSRSSCYVFMALWPIITNAGLDFLTLACTISLTRNEWLPKTRSILTGRSLPSFLVFLLLWLTDWFWFMNDSLLVYRWITNDESLTNEEGRMNCSLHGSLCSLVLSTENVYCLFISTETFLLSWSLGIHLHGNDGKVLLSQQRSDFQECTISILHIHWHV